MTFRNLILFIIPGVILSGCFTGVESTPKIGSAEVKHQNANIVTNEQQFLSDIKPQHLEQWSKGKEFSVTDARINVIFAPGSPNVELEKGDILFFEHAEEVISPVGNATDLYFTTPKHKLPLIYRVNAPIAEVKERSGVEVPFTVELSIPADVKTRLIGKELFVLTPRWYDGNDNAVTRVKYVPVSIIDVLPGSHEFPVKVIINPHYQKLPENLRFALFMSVGESAAASRNFETLFSFKNPRGKYSMITDENWTAIQENRVVKGMTRDEARLALGAPIDIDRGHDYSSTYERWIYDGGIYLIFRDGILESFRR